MKRQRDREKKTWRTHHQSHVAVGRVDRSSSNQIIGSSDLSEDLPRPLRRLSVWQSGELLLPDAVVIACRQGDTQQSRRKDLTPGFPSSMCDVFCCARLPLHST